MPVSYTINPDSGCWGVVQPAHGVACLADHPYAAVVQVHFGGLEPRVDHGAGNERHCGRTKRSTCDELVAAFLQPQPAEQS